MFKRIFFNEKKPSLVEIVWTKNGLADRHAYASPGLNLLIKLDNPKPYIYSTSIFEPFQLFSDLFIWYKYLNMGIVGN